MSPSQIAASIIESPRTRRAKTVPLPVTSRGSVSVSSTCSSAEMGVPAAMCPTTGTVTGPPEASRRGASCKNMRVSIGRDTAVPRRRKPLSSRLARWRDTDDDDRRPTASPIWRVLGAYPYRTTQSWIMARIRCWRRGSAEASRSPNASRSR